MTVYEAMATRTPGLATLPERFPLIGKAIRKLGNGMAIWAKHNRFDVATLSITSIHRNDHEMAFRIEGRGSAPAFQNAVADAEESRLRLIRENPGYDDAAIALARWMLNYLGEHDRHVQNSDVHVTWRAQGEAGFVNFEMQNLAEQIALATAS